MKLLTYDLLFSLPELTSTLNLKLPENGELPKDARRDNVLFDFPTYASLLVRYGAYTDYPIVDRKRGLVISQPLVHTFLPALLVYLEDELGRMEKEKLVPQERDSWSWFEVIREVAQYPIPKSRYPIWRSLTERFLQGGYMIHHGDRNEPITICSSSFEPDQTDRKIFRILDVLSESHHFGCRTE